MTQQTTIAYFDSRADAEKAVTALTEAGVARGSIRMLPDTETAFKRPSGASAYDHRKDEGGFWAGLKDLFLPEQDRYAYAEGMSRGGVALAITADDAQIDRIHGVVERHGAVDLDEREASWRREGWTGHQAGALSAGTASGAAATARGAADGEVIPIVEERIKIGKRQVSGGRVRIRTYTVETPVQEQVSLRQEHVHVERRPVDRVLTPEEEARLLQERTIEAEERTEEAVVSKEARVKEELVIRKDVRERTQTVQDTVRRTEVEVEDARVAGRGASTAMPDRR